MSHTHPQNQSMRFVHTADWQIGMAAAHTGEAGSRVREARLASIQTVADVCRRESAEFLLIAGDTFEDNGVGRDAVAAVVGLLQLMPCPVYVIPGNHDPLQHGSVWSNRLWDSASQVHVLTERNAVKIPGGTLYPCPLFRKRSEEDPTAWIPVASGTGIRIAMAHGHAGDIPNGDGSYGIPLDAASRADSTTWLSDTGTRQTYSAAHEWRIQVRMNKPGLVSGTAAMSCWSISPNQEYKRD